MLGNLQTEYPNDFNYLGVELRGELVDEGCSAVPLCYADGCVAANKARDAKNLKNLHFVACNINIAMRCACS